MRDYKNVFFVTRTSALRGALGTSACASAQGPSWHEMRVTNNIFCDKHQNLCENGKDTRVLGEVKSLVRVTKNEVS